MADKKRKRVYRVADKYDLLEHVVAYSYGHAKSIVMEEHYCDYEYTELRCRVVKELDDTAGSMPVGVIEDMIFLLEYDCISYAEWYECPNCGYGEGYDEHNFVFKGKDGKIVCSECRPNEWEDWW